jgi:uncharacterized membrane protein YfcA
MSDLTLLLALSLGSIVGLVLGLTGAGGSIIAVPLLMTGLGWPLATAAPVALLAVASSAICGTYSAWKLSYVRYRAALLMAALGVLTAPVGIVVAGNIRPENMTLIFAIVMVVVASRMWMQTLRLPEDTTVLRAKVHGDGPRSRGPLCRLDRETGRILWTPLSVTLMSVVGAVTGFLSGLLGVGGGFVIVPSLRGASELSMHSAVATSLMVIALISTGTFAVMLIHGREFSWTFAMPFVAGSIAGMCYGRLIAPRIAGPRLQQGFAVFLLAVSLYMICRRHG